MTRPIVGISAATLHAEFGSWSVPASLVPAGYVAGVERAGGRPLLVPPSTDAVETTVALLDGLVLSGGTDIDPSLYGDDPHPKTQASSSQRDRAELAILAEALARDLPVLAICRGMELLNVHHGGGLEQHLPDVVGHENHLLERGTFTEHRVEVDGSSVTGRAIGSHAVVKSHHHQGVSRAAETLTEAAWAEDGTVEAVEDDSRTFAVGVLWHPEAGDDQALFVKLVEEAREFARRRGRAPRG